MTMFLTSDRNPVQAAKPKTKQPNQIENGTFYDCIPTRFLPEKIPLPKDHLEIQEEFCLSQWGEGAADFQDALGKDVNALQRAEHSTCRGTVLPGMPVALHVRKPEQANRAFN